MDCLYDAFIDHARYLGCDVRPSTWKLYKVMKIATHGARPQNTYGGVTPWMIHRMAKHNGLVITFGAYNHFGVPEFLAYSRKNYPLYYLIHKLVIRERYFDVLYPRFSNNQGWIGIWLHGGSRHALFATQRPSGLIYGYYRLGIKDESTG